MDVQHALESHPSINGMCDYVGISRSGYYQREKRHNHQSPRKLRKKFIQGEIKAIWLKSLCIYGAGKITQELRSKGYKIAERTVGKYMRELGIHAVYLTPWTTTTRNSKFDKQLINILDEQFNPLRPNAVWCIDTTYIPVHDGFVYLTSIMDLYSRRIIGWDLSETLEVSNVIPLIEKTKHSRHISKPLIMHSDRGSQFTSEAYNQVTANMTLSYSKKAYPWDNACIESFHALIKREWINRFKIHSYSEAKRLNASTAFKQGEYQIVSRAHQGRFNQVLAAAHIIIASRGLNKAELDQVLLLLQNTLTLAEQREFKAAINADRGSYVMQVVPQLLERLGQLTAVIAARQAIIFTYCNVAGVLKQHEAQPETLFFDNYYFYVVMRRTPDTAARLYRLDRIRTIDKVKRGSGLPVQRFQLRDYRHQTYLLAQGEPISFSFKCWLAAQTALERFPGATQKVAKNDVPIITAQAHEEGALLWLLSQGPNVQVLSPPSLIRKINQRQRAALARYQSS